MAEIAQAREETPPDITGVLETPPDCAGEAETPPHRTGVFDKLTDRAGEV